MTLPENPTEENHILSIAAAPDFNISGICIAASVSGLQLSSDGGLTWQPAYTSLKAPVKTFSINFSPEFGSDRTLVAGVEGGLLRSIDSGATWQATILRDPPPLVIRVVFSPGYAEDGIILAATLEDGVFITTDRGDHWASWNFGLMDLNTLDLAISPQFTADETIFVGVESGIFTSTNGGRAWQEVDFPIDLAPVLCLGISPTFDRDSTLYAGTESFGLFRSTDSGQTWQRVAPKAITGTVNGFYISPEYPRKKDFMALTGETVLISHDGGRKWEKMAGIDRYKGDITAVLAPLGLEHGVPLLLGLADGRVLSVLS